MKKYIYAILAAMLVFMLSGCGSNSKSDAPTSGSGDSLTPGLSITGGNLKVDDRQNFSLDLAVEKTAGSEYSITLSDFDLAILGCSIDGAVSYNPNPLALEGTDRYERLQISGKLSEPCSSLGYSVKATETITKDGKTKIQAINYVANGDIEVLSGFFNASTPLVVSRPNTNYEISVQVVKQGQLVVGQTVTLRPFDKKYGSCTSYTAKTGSDGYAKFPYVSPAVLPADGTTTTLQLSMLDEDTKKTITQDIVLSFKEEAPVPPVDTSGYVLDATSPILITSPAQSVSIDLQLTDGSRPVENQSILVHTFSISDGRMNEMKAVTDAAGVAHFTYIAPAQLPTDSLRIVFEVEGGTPALYKTVIIEFAGNEKVDTATYTLQVVPTQLTVERAGETKTIKAYVVDNASQSPVADMLVKANWFDPVNGTLSVYSAKTDASGEAIFTYRAPDALPSGSFNITFKLGNATYEKETDMSVVFNVTGGQYSLINATTPITVNYDEELKVISVDVVDQNSVGVQGVDVSITAVNGIQYGSIISASTTQTDSSGHARFTYKAPSDVNAVDGTSTVVTVSIMDNGTMITQDIVINFNKNNTQTSKPIVVIGTSYQEINLTQNSQNVEMIIRVFEEGSNNPYTSGNVKVSLPDEVLNGIDVGNFSAYSVPVSSTGEAIFNYTGPQDLQTLLNDGHTGALFTFSHEENPLQEGNISVVYDLTAGYVPANYILTTSSTDGNQTMGLNAFKAFTFSLKNDQGQAVADTDITKVTLTSKNTLVGKLIDAANSGQLVDTLVFNGADAKNNQSFSVQTSTISGLLPIEVTIEFNDANGDPKTISTIMNIIVLSGPPTAMSIVYAGVEQNSDTAKYIEKFVVTVTDAYNNVVNTQPYIAVGGMVEYAVDGSSATGVRSTSSPRLWHGLNDDRGAIEAIGGDKAQFVGSGNVFRYIDLANDKLVVFGSGYVYEALGKWDIDSSNGSDTLQLKDDYFGSTRDNLFYAVGHNNRQDLCSAGVEYIGNVKAATYQLDENGHAFVEFEYDYHLTGKDIMIWANLTGYQADNGHTGRIGEARKHTLRGMGLVSDEVYYVASEASVRFTVHHENAAEWYRNGHFGFSTKGTCQVEGILDWSNLHDARDCANTTGYVELNVTNQTTSSTCTISIDGIAVSSEFEGVNYP